MSKFSDKAIEILENSSDGDRLTPRHLKLVEMAVNGHLDEHGEAEFEKLHADVTSDEYCKSNWFHDIENLTQEASGYVLWRGVRIEHYSHADVDASRRDANKLAERCRLLEEKQFPVNGRTVGEQCILEAPADTPWVLGMQKFYTFFESVTGDVSGIFYCQSSGGGLPEVVVVGKEGGVLKVTPQVGAYEAFHILQDSGLNSMGHIDSYSDFVGRVERIRVTPEQLDAAINRPPSSEVSQTS